MWKAQLFCYKKGNSFDPDDKEIVLNSVRLGDNRFAWMYEDNDEETNRLIYGKKYYLGVNNYSKYNYNRSQIDFTGFLNADTTVP